MQCSIWNTKRFSVKSALIFIRTKHLEKIFLYVILQRYFIKYFNPGTLVFLLTDSFLISVAFFLQISFIEFSVCVVAHSW